MFLFTAFGYVSAQEDSMKYRIDMLDEKDFVQPTDKGTLEIISASRSSKKVSDLPVTTYVITREEILSNGYFTLLDVLSSLPGVRLSKSGSAEAGQMFQMRGLKGNDYTKILIDDIPVKPSLIASMPISYQLPIRQAERIEITYGPASVLYGADAVVGVINIITKEASTGIFAQADINILDTYSNFHVGGKAGKNKKILKYSFFGSNMKYIDNTLFNDKDLYRPLSYLDQEVPPVNIDGMEYLPSELSNDQVSKLIEQGTFRFEKNFEGNADSVPTTDISSESYMIGSNFKYKALALSILHMYRKDHSSVGRTPYLYKYNNSQNFYGESVDKVSLGWDKQLKRITNRLNTYFSFYQLDNNSNFGTTYSSNKEYIYSSSADIFIEDFISYKKKFFEMVAGFSLQFSYNTPTTNYSSEPFNAERLDLLNPKFDIKVSTDIDSFGFNANAFVIGSTFIQTYFDLHRLQIMAGIRKDNNGLFDESSVSPRIAALYKINDQTSLRVSYGKAFKPPVGDQIFRSIATKEEDSSIIYAIVPNQNIVPEYFTSEEIGLRRSFLNNKINFDCSFYFNKTTNKITLGFVDPASLGYTNAYDSSLARMYVNSLGTNTKLMGVDFYLSLNNIFERFKFKMDIGGTFTKGSEILASGDEIDYIREVPKHIWKLKTYYSFKKKTYIILQNYFVSSFQRAFLPSKDYYVNEYYKKIPGYIITDFTFGIKLHTNLNMFLIVQNTGDKRYAGIDATGTDIDLRYNPQPGTNLKLGMTFNFN